MTERTMTDADALDYLLRIWNEDTPDGWNGADAVDTIGYVLTATGRELTS